MRTLIALLLALAGSSALAQSEIILDNATASFSATGTWPTSTSVAGFIGPNYQSHEPNGAPPGAIVVDNAGAGFSVTGTWPASTSVSGYVGANYQVHTPNGEPPASVVADNSSGSAVGTWPNSTSVSGYIGTNYQTHAAGSGANTFTWTLNVPTAGSYEVRARWTAHPNRATNARYTVNHAGGAQVVTVNMEQGGGQWNTLGTFSFDAGATTISLSDDADGYVIADAVLVVPPGAAPNTATWTLSVPSSGQYKVYARWTQHPNRATNAPYTVSHAAGSTTVLVNQEAGGGQWFLLGTFGFDAGSATVTLTDQANDYVIADAVMLAPADALPNTATWTPNVPQAGQYELYARWTSHANRATNATYTVTHAGGSTPVAVNQQAAGGAWNLLGTFSLSPGSAHNIALTDQANGFVIADAIRLVPLAAQAQPKLHFIHVDHLNTPRLVANSSGTPVWRWDQQEPFGVNVPDENPSALGAFEFPLRFPGQYADKETNLYYNYFRDCYDPATGRYCQSDPIGLRGGVNTYIYVDGAPLFRFDKWGLQAFGIGIEPPAGTAVNNGTLNPAADPGHTFAYLLDANNQVTAILSVGPSSPIGPLNKNSFLNGTLPAVSNWPIAGQIYTYQWPMNPQQYEQCRTVLAKMQSNPGNYSPTNQCTSAALSAAQQCGISVPDGVSAIHVPPVRSLFSGYSNNLPNPYGLMQQLNQTMTPQPASAAQFQQNPQKSK